MSITLSVYAPTTVYCGWKDDEEETDPETLRSLHRYFPPGIRTLIEYIRDEPGFAPWLAIVEPETFPFTEYDEAGQRLVLRCVYIVERQLARSEMKAIMVATAALLHGRLGEDFLVFSGGSCGLAIAADPAAVYCTQAVTDPSRDRLW